MTPFFEQVGQCGEMGEAGHAVFPDAVIGLGCGDIPRLSLVSFLLRSHLKTRTAIEIVAKAFAFRRLKPKNKGLYSSFPARKGG